MKRLLALLLAIMMVLSLFAGCGKSEEKESKKDRTKQEDDETEGDETEGDETEGDETEGDETEDDETEDDESKSDDEDDEDTQPSGTGTLVIGIPKSSLVTDYYNNYYTQWLEEQTGLKLEFQFFSAAQADYQSQLSTMVASIMYNPDSKVTLPDIVYGFNLGTEAYEDYGAYGTFVDLADYFNDKEGKAKVWWEQFEQLSPEAQEEIWNRMQTKIEGADNRIYAFPEIQVSTVDTMDYQVWINQEWLDNLGLEMPTNIDELRYVLEQFKEKDANGNGDSTDEIPLIGTKDNLGGHTLDWLINMFLYADRETMLNVDENGKLYSPYTTEQYREALSFIRGLIRDGLLSPLTLNAKPNDLQLAVTPASGAQIAGVVCGHLNQSFVTDDPGLLNYQPLPLWGNAVNREVHCNFTTFITDDCYKRGNMDDAWKLLMVMSTQESAIIQRYGAERTAENPEGSWEWVTDENAKSVMGTKAVIRLYQDTWATRGNDNWRTVEATILFNAEGEGNQELDANSEGEVRLHKYDLFNQALENYTNQMETYNPEDKYICPLLVWTDVEKIEGGDAREACKKVIMQWRTDFLTGVKDAENPDDWQEYLSQLDKYGYEEWLYYSQQAYDRAIAGE